MALPRQVLTISSQVAAGPVGNSAIVPALLALGVTPIALSTIILSNHPGHGRPEGLAMPAEKLASMLKRLIELGFLGDDVVVLTGYFVHEEQIAALAPIIAGLPKSFYLCDPILGDTHKGLYVAEAVARGIRDKLVPLADALIPNVFELGWLAGHTVTDRASALAAASVFPGKSVLATSLPEGSGLTTALIERGRLHAVARPKLDQVPQGTGDLLSGLLAARLAQGHTLKDSLGLAVAAVEHVIAKSLGTASLDLARGLKDIGAIAPHAVSDG